MNSYDFRQSRLVIDDDGIALFEHLRGEARNPFNME